MPLAGGKVCSDQWSVAVAVFSRSLQSQSQSQSQFAVAVAVCSRSHSLQSQSQFAVAVTVFSHSLQVTCYRFQVICYRFQSQSNFSACSLQLVARSFSSRLCVFAVKKVCSRSCSHSFPARSSQLVACTSNLEAFQKPSRFKWNTPVIVAAHTRAVFQNKKLVAPRYPGVRINPGINAGSIHIKPRSLSFRRPAGGGICGMTS